MADNSSIPVASGNETFANKDIGGVKFPKHIQYDSSGAEVEPATETTAEAILAKIIAAPATEAKQDTGNSSLATIAGAVSSSKVATKAASGDFADGALATIGAKTDNKSTSTDTTSVSAMSVWKQISASVQALATAVSSSKAAVKAASGDFVDGAIATLGAKTDAKSTATDGTSVSAMQVLKQISASVQGAIPAGTNHIGKVQVGDGTNNAVVKAASTAAAATDPALVVAIRPDSIKDAYAEYETVAAGQTDQALGATGAQGDYLAGVLIVPGTAGCGAVSIKDGSGSSISIFAGGGTTALPTLAPIFVPLGIYSTGGAWKITTGSNVTAIGIGDFT